MSSKIKHEEVIIDKVNIEVIEDLKTKCAIVYSLRSSGSPEAQSVAINRLVETPNVNWVNVNEFSIDVGFEYNSVEVVMTYMDLLAVVSKLEYRGLEFSITEELQSGPGVIINDKLLSGTRFEVIYPGQNSGGGR